MSGLSIKVSFYMQQQYVKIMLTFNLATYLTRVFKSKANYSKRERERERERGWVANSQFLSSDYRKINLIKRM